MRLSSVVRHPSAVLELCEPVHFVAARRVGKGPAFLLELDAPTEVVPDTVEALLRARGAGRYWRRRRRPGWAKVALFIAARGRR